MRSRILFVAMTMVLGSGVRLALATESAAPVPSAAPLAWQGPANAWIASHAMRIHGTAPRDKRLTCEGDLNGDGHADVVVVYTIEGVGGGNDWTQYVTVLTSTPQGFGAMLPKEVGAKGKRAVASCTVTGAGVDVAVKDHAPEDASCCPSKPGHLRLAFGKGGLVDEPAAVPSGQ